MIAEDGRVADAEQGNWVDASAPASWRPYLRLMRADRLHPVWFLLLPCWWSLGLAGATNGFELKDAWLAVAFLIGAIAMRGAGCCLNDIVDRNIDDKVERTRSRPIPSGAVTPVQAMTFMGALCLVGLAVLLTMNRMAILVALASLVLVAIYPFMKRLTDWPQFFLGLAFNCGALVGWTAQTGALDWPALWLYLAGICWTIGYDTIYAHQDREDDLQIGVRSTALRFGNATHQWVGGFYGASVLLACIAMVSAGVWIAALPLVIPYAAHLVWQLRTLDIDNPAICLSLFRSNREAGLRLLAALLLGGLFVI